jgi:hypothetical protein
MTELHDFERHVRAELLRTVESVNPPRGAAERAIAAARAGAESRHLRRQRVRQLILPLAAAAAAVVLVAGVALVSQSNLDDAPAGPSPQPTHTTAPDPSLSPSPSVTASPSGAATGGAVAPSPTSTSPVPAKVVIPPAGAAAGNPALIGHLDSVSVQAGQVSLHGWAADTRTPGQSINVGYSITNGTNTASGRIRSGQLRTAVGHAYPALGNNHGFSATNYVSPGASTVCAWAMDPAGGANRSIGCTTARVPADTRARGHLDSVRSLGSGQIQVSGWAADIDTPTTPVRLAIYLGSATAPYKTVSVTADQASQAAAAAYPLIGPNHGFSATIPARPGTQPVCAWAIDTYIYGGPTLLGCLNVTA